MGLQASLFKYFSRPAGLVAVLWVVVLLAGCGGEPDGDLAQIKPPPDIPPPPEQKEEILEVQSLPDSDVTARQRANLRRALQHAVELDLVDSTASVASLRQPITRGELAFWLAGFRDVRPVESPLPTFEDVPPDHPYYMAIESVTTARMMRGRMQAGELRFFPEQTVSREELASIYTRLIGKAEEAENNGAIVYDSMRPPAAMGASQNFENFVDYDQISPRNRGHVAMAYRDDVLYETFGLTPKSLVTLKGFHPTVPVTRLEALLFLETSFGGGD